MAAGRLDRVAVVVSDLDAVAKELKTIFDVDLTVLDAANLGVRAAIGNEGFELIEKVAESSPLEPFWRPPLAALAVRCEDLDDSVERMQAAGYAIDHVTTTPGGVREVSFGNEFHGIPLVLYAYPGDDFVGSVTGGTTQDYTAQVTPS